MMTIYVLEASSFCAGVAIGVALVFVFLEQRRRDTSRRERYLAELNDRSRVNIAPRALIPPPPPTKEAS